MSAAPELKPCPLIERLLELSATLDRASNSESVHSELLAKSSEEIDAITDEMEKRRSTALLASAAARERQDALIKEAREVMGGLIEAQDRYFREKWSGTDKGYARAVKAREVAWDRLRAFLSRTHTNQGDVRHVQHEGS